MERGWQNRAALTLPSDSKDATEKEQFTINAEFGLTQALANSKTRFFYADINIPCPDDGDHANALIVDKQEGIAMYIEPAGIPFVPVRKLNHHYYEARRRILDVRELIDYKVVPMFGDVDEIKPNSIQYPLLNNSTSLLNDQFFNAGYGPQFMELKEQQEGLAPPHEGHCCAWTTLCAERFVEHASAGKHYSEFGWRNIAARNVKAPFATEVRNYVRSAGIY
jgi:hypothetical protein